MEKLLNKKNKTYDDYIEISIYYLKDESPATSFKYIKEGFMLGQGEYKYFVYYIFDFLEHYDLDYNTEYLSVIFKELVRIDVENIFSFNIEAFYYEYPELKG